MYDPSLPAPGSPLDSAVMRSQLTGLKDLIDAILTITAAQVDSVSTGNPGDPASVGLAVIGNTLHFTFSLPRGEAGPTGAQGDPGLPGMNGTNGAPGPQGPPFAAALIDGVNTLNPGDSATVTVVFDGANVRFTFGIPRGSDGAPGANGTDGAPGAPGPAGEVTNAALASAISGTSNNSNAVATLGLAISDPPTQGEVQQVVNKIDELINALRRV